MADERFLLEKPQAGGPRVYLSTGFQTSEAGLVGMLPDMTGETVSPDAKVFIVALDTVIATDAITVGGEALVFVAADPSDGEVLLGADDEAAATNLAAAINALSLTGVTAVADAETLTIRSATNPDLTCTTLDTTITITDLGGWIFLPDTTDDIEPEFVETHEKVRPTYRQQATGSAITAKGVEGIAVAFARRSLDAMALALTQATLTEQNATSSSVATRTLKYNADAAPTVYRHLVQVLTGENGYWQVHIFPKVSPVGKIKPKYGEAVTKLNVEFAVYAHDGCGTVISPVFHAVEMTGPKTS